MKQWIVEVEKLYGFTPGQLGAGANSMDSPLVVGSVRTLYNRLDSIRDVFGTILLDEMHHVSSKTFSAIINQSRARYKIGLSGTIERKDGKHVVFKDYFSPTVHTPRKTNVLDPIVHSIHSDITIPGGSGVPWATRMTELAFNPEYQELIVFLAKTYQKIGHKILVVSDRVHLLNTCGSILEDDAIVITGEMNDYEERQKQLARIRTDKDIIFGTLSIFSEGFSESSLSCVILASPINNDPLLKQICARINRKKEGKKQPVVVDIQLGGGTGRRQANNRRGFYLGEGWQIKDF
jgi:superfamily II DNA or RNA helicase